MFLGLENAFGIHERALLLRAERAQVLASNLANTDTPNFKARDIDFRALLGSELAGREPALATTHARHLGGMQRGSIAAADLKYRIPLQPVIDGNTVDAHVEQAAFMDNAIRYQATLGFLDGRIRGVIGALRGE